MKLPYPATSGANLRGDERQPLPISHAGPEPGVMSPRMGYLMTMESARDLFLHDARSMYGGIRRLERGFAKVEEHVGEMQLTNLIHELGTASGEQADG